MGFYIVYSEYFDDRWIVGAKSADKAISYVKKNINDLYDTVDINKADWDCEYFELPEKKVIGFWEIL